MIFESVEKLFELIRLFPCHGKVDTKLANDQNGTEQSDQKFSQSKYDSLSGCLSVILQHGKWKFNGKADGTCTDESSHRGRIVTGQIFSGESF